METLFRARTMTLLAAAAVLLASGCKNKQAPPPQPTMTEMNVAKPPQIGGQDVITMSRGRSGDGSRPEFLSVTMLPGRGMNVYQVTAWIPGRGEVNLISSPSLEETAKLLNGDKWGNKSFTIGGAFLVPFANRILGKVSPDGQTVSATWHDHTISLPANWVANNDGVAIPGHEKHAIHGLILDKAMDNVSVQKDADGSTVTGILHAGDFGGHWFSTNDVKISAKLVGDSIDFIISVTNTGKQPEPIGIGWHPYFTILSGDRSQVLLHVPATQYATVNNHDDVFPTGKLESVKGTPLDFTPTGGVALPATLVDDTFTGLTRDMEDSAAVELRDPAAKYGLRLVAISPAIQAIQVYAPPTKKFVAIEPQFNFADPFGKEWKDTYTGMKDLGGGDSVSWHVRLELFVP